MYVNKTMTPRLKNEIVYEISQSEDWDMSELFEKQEELLQTTSFAAILDQIQQEADQIRRAGRIRPANETEVQDFYCVLLRKLVDELGQRFRSNNTGIEIRYVHDEKLANLFVDFNLPKLPKPRHNDTQQDTLELPFASSILDCEHSRDLEKEYFFYLRWRPDFLAISIKNVADNYPCGLIENKFALRNCHLVQAIRYLKAIAFYYPGRDFYAVLGDFEQMWFIRYDKTTRTIYKSDVFIFNPFDAFSEESMHVYTSISAILEKCACDWQTKTRIKQPLERFRGGASLE